MCFMVLPIHVWCCKGSLFHFICLSPLCSLWAIWSTCFRISTGSGRVLSAWKLSQGKEYFTRRREKGVVAIAMVLMCGKGWSPVLKEQLKQECNHAGCTEDETPAWSESYFYFLSEVCCTAVAKKGMLNLLSLENKQNIMPEQTGSCLLY